MHLVDVSGASGRDPVDDLDTVRKELELFQPALAAKPQIVAANKMDAVDPTSDARHARSSGARRARPAVPADLRRQRRRACRSCSKRCGGAWRRRASRPPDRMTTPRGASASSAARSIRFTAAISTSADAASAALQLTDMLLVITSNVPPHRPQPLASSLPPLRDGGARRSPDRPDWRASDLELRHDAPSYTSRTLERFHERGYRAVGAVLRHRRRRVRRDRNVARLSRRSSTRRISRSSRGPGLPVERAAAAAAASSRRAWCRSPVDAVAQLDPLIILIDAPTADVSSTAIRERLRARANRSPGWCRRACSNTLSSTDFTRRRRRDGARSDAPRHPRQAGCMAKTEKRRKTRRGSRADRSGDRRGRRQEGGRPRGARPAQGGRLHRLLRDLLGHQRAAGARDRRRGDGGAGGRRRQAGARRGLRPIGVDPARLLRLHRPRLRAGDARVLRPRAALGERRADRSPAGDDANADCRTQIAGSADRPRMRSLQSCDCASTPTRSRGPPRAGLRRVRRAARAADPRSGLRRLLAVDPAADAAALRPLRRSAADLARRQHAARRCPRCRRDAPSRRPRPRDRRLRRRAARDRPCAQIRRPPLAGPAAGRADARSAAPTCSTAPRASSRCRSIRRGAGSAASIRRPIWRAISGCRSCAALRRVRATPTQTGLPAARRHRNVRDAFAADASGARRSTARSSC